MGIYKEERDVKEEEEKAEKSKMACMWSSVVSMAGGLMLGWWEYEYHPTYSQLWMVPFGLILFITPLIVWFSVYVSDFCNSAENANSSSSTRPVCDSVHDPERCSKESPLDL